MAGTDNNRDLIVDDDPDVRELTPLLFDDQNNVATAASGEEGLALLLVNQYRVVISDTKMGALSGPEMFVKYGRKMAGKPMPIALRAIMSSGSRMSRNTLDNIKEAWLERIITAAIRKPFNGDIIRAIDNLGELNAASPAFFDELRAVIKNPGIYLNELPGIDKDTLKNVLLVSTETRGALMQFGFEPDELEKDFGILPDTAVPQMRANVKF